MSKVGVKYRLADNVILGLVAVSQDFDLALNFDPMTEGMIDIPLDHQVQYEQDKWEILNGELRRKQDA